MITLAALDPLDAAHVQVFLPARRERHLVADEVRTFHRVPVLQRERARFLVEGENR